MNRRSFLSSCVAFSVCGFSAQAQKMPEQDNTVSKIKDAVKTIRENEALEFHSYAIQGLGGMDKINSSLDKYLDEFVTKIEQGKFYEAKGDLGGLFIMLKFHSNASVTNPEEMGSLEGELRALEKYPQPSFDGPRIVEPY